MGLVCYVQEPGLHPKGNGGPPGRLALGFIRISGCCVVWIGRGEEHDSNQNGAGWTVGGSSRERGKRWVIGILRR